MGAAHPSVDTRPGDFSLRGIVDGSRSRARSRAGRPGATGSPEGRREWTWTVVSLGDTLPVAPVGRARRAVTVRPLGERLFRFAVVADTHLEPDGAPGTPASPRSNRRFAAAIAALSDDPPAFALHLGDVVHPLPELGESEAAAAAAEALLATMPCPLHLTAGNHDIGDKPNPLVPAAAVRPDWIARFDRRFGPATRAFDHEGCRFVLFNDLLVNSGLPEEEEAFALLEEALATADRAFLATHYPPFLHAADEGTLYDNLDEPGRSRLLDIVARHGVEAVFAGHVHVFLHNRHRGVEIYGAPSVAFVRRDFSERFRVAPFAEAGREDPERVGFLVVDVHERGHVARMVRAADCARPPGGGPAPSGKAGEWSGFGVTLRHSWCGVTELPVNPPVDPFARKRVRDDDTLLALLELGLRDLRVPAADLIDPETAQRAALLASLGFRFTAFVAGLPAPQTVAALLAAPAPPETLEIVSVREALPSAVDHVAPALSAAGVRLQLTPLVPPQPGSEGRAGMHRVLAGLPPEPAAVAALAPLGRPGLALVAGISVPLAVVDGALLDALDVVARQSGVAAAILADWAETDKDRSAADAEALAAAIDRIAPRLATPRPTRLFLDTLAEFDRGYHVRAGLLDRRANLTAAGRAVMRAAARAATGALTT